MNSSLLPAYSLRVQLFSPKAHTLDNKPIRNFRVVTSPEITVREFCEEASRIHEINYGFALAIKKVQDDQAFDITQNEILGSIFTPSSIIRVIQAPTQPDIRDSVPPNSALRFEPSAYRRRGRTENIEIETSTSRKRRIGSIGNVTSNSRKRGKIASIENETSGSGKRGTIESIESDTSAIRKRRTIESIEKEPSISQVEREESIENELLTSHVGREESIELETSSSLKRGRIGSTENEPSTSQVEREDSIVNEPLTSHVGREESIELETSASRKKGRTEVIENDSLISQGSKEEIIENDIVQQKGERKERTDNKISASGKDMVKENVEHETSTSQKRGKKEIIENKPSVPRKKGRKESIRKTRRSDSNIKRQETAKEPPEKCDEIETKKAGADNIERNHQPKICTPILPQKRQSIIPPKKKSLNQNATPVTASNSVSSNKIGPPSKVTPIIPPNKKHLSTRGLSQGELPTKKTAPVGKQDTTPESRANVTISKAIDPNPTLNQEEALCTSKTGSLPQTNEIKNQEVENQHVQGSGEEEYETHSKGSPERESRSPISFHRTPHSSDHQRSPTLSSDTHSESLDFKDLEILDEISSRLYSGSNAVEGGANQQCIKLSETSQNKNRKSNGEVQSTPDIDNTSDNDYQKKNTINYSPKVQVLKSSPPSQQTLPSHSSGISINSKKTSNNQASIITPIRRPSTIPPSSEVRKPHFAFGASLTDMHQNGRIVSRSQDTKKPPNPSALSTWDKAGSHSVSETSDSDSQASSTEEEALPISQSQVARPPPSSGSDSDDSDTQQKKALQRAKQEAKNALVAKIKGLTHSQPSSGTGHILSLSQVDGAAKTNTRRTSLRSSVNKGHTAAKKRGNT
ncbi:hypothetical protein K3495_g4100 [Podosphaera aphanis]|nr:hypothetical protein K3495_g4100 [Podosphaera aphanis]